MSCWIVSLQKTISFFRIHKKLEMFFKKTSSLILALSLLLIPVTVYGSVSQSLHFEWSYDTTLPDLAGYTIYQNGHPIFDVNDPTVLRTDWTATLESGINSFTITALDVFGNTSAHSAPYIIDVPPADANGNIPPVADLQASQISGDLPLTIDFDGTGSIDFDGSITNYSWDYGDGSIDTGGRVSHIYQSAGTFMVALKVTDNAGVTSTTTTIITVTDPAPQNNTPTGAITVNVSAGEAPLFVNFDGTNSTDGDGYIVDYSWEFGDGSRGSGSIYGHTYTTAGIYTATLTVRDNEGATSDSRITITITKPIIPNVPPTATIIANPLSGNSPLQVNFSGIDSTDHDGTIVSYSWDFGDGSATGGSVVSHQFISGGTYTVTLTVIDDGGDSHQQQVVIIVNSIPQAGNITLTTTEDNSVSGSLTATDAEGDSLTYSIISNGALGTVTIVDYATGAFSYTPNVHISGTDTFTFKANDGRSDSNLATVTINITGSNDLPTAVNDTSRTNEDTTATIAVLDNDTDVDNDTLTISTVSQGNNGRVAISGTTLVYTPDADWFGTDSFTYTITDGNGGSDTATVSITVNDIPIAISDNFLINEDTSVSGALIANDQSNVLIYSLVNQPAMGAVSLNTAVGGFTYTPDINANGTDTFTFKVHDGLAESNTATITILITPINDPPIAITDSVTTSAGVSIAVDVLANDSDVDGDSLTINSVSQGINGSIIIDGTVATYTPNEFFYGTDFFVYVVSDGHGGLAEATVTVTIPMPFVGRPPSPPPDAINNTPTVSDSLLIINEDTAVRGNLQANDIDGDLLTYTITSNGLLGNAVLANITTGAFIYTPNRNAYGTDTFTFKVNDGRIDSRRGIITITINSVNDLPVTTADSVIIDEDSQVMINVLVNDFDVDNDDLIVHSVAAANHGSTSIINNKVLYTPSQYFYGEDSFIYEVNDGHGKIVTETIFINILPINDAPIIYKKADFTINEDTQLNGKLSVVDPDGDLLTFTIVNDHPEIAQGTSLGQVSLVNSETGTFTYMPNSDATGIDSFTFTVDDGWDNIVTGFVTITIIPINDTPLAIDTELIVNDYQETIGKLRVYDADNELFIYTIIVHPTKGRLSYFNPETGSYVYTPDSDIEGTDFFIFTVSDDTTTSNRAAITIIFNQSPVAIAGGPYSGTVNQEITFDADNSYDPDGNIKLYEWDWNNDGEFDQSTELPIAGYTWIEPFNGEIILRITDNKGTISIDSTPVSIVTP